METPPITDETYNQTYPPIIIIFKLKKTAIKSHVELFMGCTRARFCSTITWFLMHIGTEILKMVFSAHKFYLLWHAHRADYAMDAVFFIRDHYYVVETSEPSSKDDDHRLWNFTFDVQEIDIANVAMFDRFFKNDLLTARQVVSLAHKYPGDEQFRKIKWKCFK